MAHKICCVPGCGKSRSDNVSLHMFPDPDNDADRFRTWLYTIGGDILQLDNQKILKYRKVCDRHFEEIYHTRSKRLSANAVPTLYMPGLRKRQATGDITNQSCNYLEVQPSTSAGMKDTCGIKSDDVYVTEKTVTEQPMTSAGHKRKQKQKIIHSSETSLLIRKIKRLQKANESYSSRTKLRR